MLNRTLGIGVSAFIVAGTSLAQTPPDAGALRQQIEQQSPKLLPEQRKPLTSLPPDYVPAPGLSVTVKQFRFAGNTLLNDGQLAPGLSGFLNRPLDFNGLQQATAAVSEAYRAAGWMVRVYLPRQEIVDGIVTLQIVESIFGHLQTEGAEPARLRTGIAERYVSASQPGGAPLSVAAIDRSMLLLDDLPGITVQGNLVAGSALAETDLIFKITDTPLFEGDVGADNAGTRSTGQERLTANLYLNSPLRFGDQLSANVIHSRGSDYGRLAYSLPIGYDGLRLGVNASRMDYEVILPEFRAANIHGQSTTWGLDAAYPLIRSRASNLYLNAAFDEKEFDNRASGATTSRYGVQNFTVGLTGNLFDQLGGGGANSASLNVTAGELDLSGSPSKLADALTTRSDGHFTKARYSLSRQQVLTADLSLYAQLSGQFSSKNLDSSEKFYLGGANGVRAYPASEGGGAEGTLLNLELRWRVANSVVVTGFYDWGSVTVNKNNQFAGAPAINRYELDGIGASISWMAPMGLILKGVYAHRLGNNPNRDNLTGKDQDGSLVKDRFWLTASLPF